MKPIKFLFFTFLLLALLWPSTAFAKGLSDDKVIFGGTYILEAGESLDGNLVVFGGAATLEPGSTANGDVVLIGGTLEVSGQVNGNLVGIGGAVRLREEAIVNGDLVTFGATLDRDEGARVAGEVVSGAQAPFTLNLPDQVDGNVGNTPKISVQSNPILDAMWFFFRIFMYAALAILLVIFLSKPVERVAQAAFSQPVVTGVAGLLTAVMAPLALITLTITIILIPVTLVAILLLVAAWLMGWVALGLEVGKRIAKALNVELAPAISAGIGTFILFFVLGGFSKVLPCIGLLPQTVVGFWALGAVLMTRFGTQDYVVSGSASPANPIIDAKAALPESDVSGAEPADLEIEADSSPEEDLPPDD